MGNKIGGGKSKGSADGIPGLDGSDQGPWAAEHGLNMGHVAVEQRLPDAGAADSVAPPHDGRDGMELEFVCVRMAGEEMDVAFAVVAESPVFSNGDGADRCAGEFVEKVRGGHFRHGAVEAERSENPNAKGLGDDRLVTQWGEQPDRSLVGCDHLDRVGVKCDQCGISTLSLGCMYGMADDFLMSDVEAIEDSDRDMKRASMGLEFGESAVGDHGAEPTKTEFFGL